MTRLTNTQPEQHARSVQSIGEPSRYAEQVEKRQPQTRTIRLMTYNIQCGKQWPKVRDFIRQQQVDVICLQEVPQDHHPRADYEGVSTMIDDLNWPHDFQLLQNQAPRAIGNLTLTHGRIESGQVLKAPTSQAYGMSSRVDVGGVRLTIVNIHLCSLFGPPLLTFAPTEIMRLREIHHLARWSQTQSGSIVAAGDFNTFWPSPGCWQMRRHWQDCRAVVGGEHPATRPTYGLPFVIDHVLLRGNIMAHDYRVLPVEGSDHRPIIVTLQIS